MTPRRLLAAVATGVVATLVAGVGLAPPASAATVSYASTPVASWRTNGTGYAVLVVGNVVYVGGTFTSSVSPSGSTTARANLAAFNATTGALITTFRADTNGVVRALATDGSQLFVGGQFTTVNGVSRARVAAVSLTTGAVQSFTANATSTVYALAVGGGQLFVGGAFGNLKGATRNRVGAVRISNGALTSFAPSMDNTVLALAATADASRVYVGGNFTTVDGASRPYLAAFTSSGAVVNVAWNRVSAQVLSLSLRPDGTRLGVAYGGYTNSVAYYNTSSGARLWIAGCDGDAQAVAVIADSVLAGHHEGCKGNLSTKLVSYAASNGATDSSFTPAINQFWGVWSISGTAAVLAVAGDFTWISGVRVQGFAIFRQR